jgi:UDP-N-acetylglucosamine 2-epimerase (non-hydrolysing)
MIIHLVAAARPNFMKIAPLYHALKKEPWADPVIVHTGQHYDLNMSEAFFQDLFLPKPHLHLGVGSGSHAVQTGQVMIAYERVLQETKPDLVIVVGDVNSTLACTLSAAKVQYSTNQSAHQRRRPLVAHLEAGLRSFDRTMPEEINRLVTDALADILWTPSPDADENLISEGINPDKIHRVGNIMIDSLVMLRKKISNHKVYEELGLKSRNYGLITLHRPSNVDDPKVLSELCYALVRISENMPLVFPIHPRTRKNLESNRLMTLLNEHNKLTCLQPLGYISFMSLLFHSRFCITDSGGIQEETTYLGIPCLTMRPNTERPITLTHGTNRLCDLHDLESRLKFALSKKTTAGCKIELWDGKTATRVVQSIKNKLN